MPRIRTTRVYLMFLILGTKVGIMSYLIYFGDFSMHVRLKTILIFLSIIVSILIIMSYSIYKLQELSTITQKMYTHPINVLNATKDIKINLLLIDTYMKDILLTKDEDNLENIVKNIKKNEKIINKSFEVIFENYLGEKQDIQSAYEVFNDLKVLKNKTIILLYTEEYNAANKIIMNDISSYSLNLHEKINFLIDYANNKAKYFLTSSNNKKSSLVSIIYISTGLSVLVLTMVLIFTLFRIRKFENKSTKSFNHFQTVINTSVSAIIAIDKHLNILTFNPAATKMFGYTFEEMGNAQSLVSLIPQKYVEVHQKALINFIKTEQSIGVMDRVIELEAKRKDGTVFPINIAISSSGTKENLVIVANIIDITSEKEKEKQLLQKSRLAQMGEMISMIAHQWKQPLSAISSAIINLKLKVELESFDMTTQKGRMDKDILIYKTADSIENNINMLSQIISDFKDFYKQTKNPMIISLESIVEKSLTVMNASLIKNQITVSTQYNTQDTMSIYSNEIMQVLLSILTNATENFEDKKISNPLIKILVNPNTIEISDNGGGIPEDILKSIFDPYFSTKHHKDGTGLGLYMSKMIVEDHHNGKLFVENTEEGACFILKLQSI